MSGAGKERGDPAFYPGVWGKDGTDPLTLARFILRPTNINAAEHIATLIAALVEIKDTDGAEINPCNYSHEDVCNVNQAWVDAFLTADAALNTFSAIHRARTGEVS